ncbi:hypothetical protein GCM10007923_09750 [Shinella yambaruensis]|uniref:Transmemrbane protein n=3 Tax=Rhizobiaceae TaxID=82115 RepID=A0ABQ5ZCP6_9HYPH|nr:hypothetical protein GCM10007923_09750 [Shinella yambaruensis]
MPAGLALTVRAMVADSAKGPRPSLTETLFALFLRLAAIVSLWFALQYWAMLTGFSFGGQGRFDLLPPAWKAAYTALAVLFPVAAVGLWLLVSWGPVIWLIAAATEIAMHEVYPSTFGVNRLLVLTHGAIALVFVLFRIALFVQRRRQARTVRTDSP